MTRFTEDTTKDTDFRVLRPKDGADAPKMSCNASADKRRRTWRTISGIVIVLLIAVGATLIALKNGEDSAENDIQYIYEPETQSTTDAEPFIGTAAAPEGKPFTEHTSRTINDILMDIYIPHGGKAELAIGMPAITDSTIILAAQAADIRADNGKIVGAFVLNGEPLSWGISKKGFSAVIDNKITVGVAENSPLFEEATEKGGYFFRQYPLVSEGRAIDNEPKGKSIRKALCDRKGEIMVIITANPESFHDFAQALADFGVDNAVYLVGSGFSYGFYRDGQGRATEFSKQEHRCQKFENYLIWRR